MYVDRRVIALALPDFHTNGSTRKEHYTSDLVTWHRGRLVVHWIKKRIWKRAQIPGWNLLVMKAIPPGVTRVVGFVNVVTNTDVVASLTFETSLISCYLITLSQLHDFCCVEWEEWFIIRWEGGSFGILYLYGGTEKDTKPSLSISRLRAPD
jgi:hypothetical protein